MDAVRYPLADVIKDIQNVHILVVGDLMLDHYVYGDVHRRAPEADVPVLSATQESFILGGAGGVVANIAGLGARAHVLGMVADDRAGNIIRALLGDMNADAPYLTTTTDRPSIVKLRFMKGADLLLRTDYETIMPLAESDEQAVIKNIPAAISQCGAVILSDYGKGMLTKNIIAAVMAAAHKQKIPVLVDPKGKDFTIYRGANIITPNAKELQEATNMPTAAQAEVIDAAQALIRVTGIQTVIAKQSAQGMSIISSASPPVHFPATATQAQGVAGAGDTVIATLAAALATGSSVTQAAEIANQAAGIIVVKPGTTPITKAELMATLTSDDTVTSGRQAPVFTDWALARDQIRAWKAQGLTVGFTNGCFDILHYGHVSYLNRARDKCDRLIVGLNADASITRLKGAGRPVHEEQSRAAVMAALGCVDMVALFGSDIRDDDKPLRIIEALQPDIAFKGGDYKIEDLPEAKIVLAYGGRFEIMPVYEGHSTTAAIRKIRKTG